MLLWTCLILSHVPLVCLINDDVDSSECNSSSAFLAAWSLSKSPGPKTPTSRPPFRTFASISIEGKKASLVPDVVLPMNGGGGSLVLFSHENLATGSK